MELPPLLLLTLTLAEILAKAQAKRVSSPFRSEMKSKTCVFVLHFAHLFVILRQETPYSHKDEETSVSIIMCVTAGGVHLLIGR